MAKFKINSTLITSLTEGAMIDGSGDITIRFRHRPDTPSEDQYHELTFNAINDVIETDNRLGGAAVEHMPVPAIKQNGEWLFGDPNTTKLFEAVAEEDVTATRVPHSHGNRVTSPHSNRLLQKYKRETGAAVPAGRDYETLSSWVTTARSHYAGN